MLGRRRRTAVGAAAVVVWVALLVWSRDTFIFHDSWKYLFPMLYGMTQEATCSGFPLWLGKVDSGSPMLIYTISTSATQLLRVPVLYLIGCLQPDVQTALYIYKAHIATVYLAFSVSMYVLGRVLFERALSAMYLFVATLFAGLVLQTLHSDQAISVLFWWPWILSAIVLWSRHRSAPEGRWYFIGAVLCLGLQMLDQYPHFVVLPAAIGLTVAVMLWREEARMHRRELRRLWPAVVIVIVVGMQLWIIKQAIGDYLPSLRSSLHLDPRTFDETGFVQPTALIGALLPVTFLQRFEVFADGLSRLMSSDSWVMFPKLFRLRRGFMFQLDSVLFYLGFIPTVLVVAFAIRPRFREIRTWWIAVGGALLAVSLQETALYFVLLRLPFFDVFRSYALYAVFVVCALLVMSGYGFDAYLTLDREARRRLLRRSVGIVLAVTGLAFLALLMLGRIAGSTSMSLLWIDAAIIVIGTAAIWGAAESRRSERFTVGLIVVLVVSQSAYFVVAHRLLGISGRQVLERYRLDDNDSTPASDAPGLVLRKECHTLAQCYVSRRHTVSLRTDLQGTFLRSRREPMFQPGIEPAIVRALSGLTHPIFWFSHEAAAYSGTGDLVARLNAARDSIGDELRRVVYVSAQDLPSLEIQRERQRDEPRLLTIEQQPDLVRLRYETSAAVLLNASITYDEHWVARVNGRPIPVRRAYFNGLVVPVEAGRGEIVLSYESWPSRFVFATRCAGLLASLAVIAFAARAALRYRIADEDVVASVGPQSLSRSAAAPHG